MTLTDSYSRAARDRQFQATDATGFLSLTLTPRQANPFGFRRLLDFSDQFHDCENDQRDPDQESETLNSVAAKELFYRGLRVERP